MTTVNPTLKSPTREVFSRLLMQSLWIVVVTVLTIVASAISIVYAPFVFSRSIDQLSQATVVSGLMSSFLIYAAIMGIALSLGQIVKYLAALTAEKLTQISSTSFFRELTTKDAVFFTNHNAVEIQSAQTQGVAAFNTITQLGLMYILPSILQFSFTIYILGSIINYKIVIIVIIYGFLYIAITYYSNQWARPHLERATAAIQRNARFVGNSIPAIESLRFFGSMDWMNTRFSENAEDVYSNWRSYCAKRMIYCAGYGIALTAQFSATFFLLIPQYEAGQLSIGDIVLFNILLLQLNLPFEMVGQTIDNIVRAVVQLRPFSAMWHAPSLIETSPHCAPQLTHGTLSFKNVSYHYDNGKGVEDVSFSAERGTVTFLTGKTGSGKSTAFKLALRTLAPQTGTIEVDGIDIQSIARTEWYAHLGVVPQEVMLLNDDFATNIVLGRAYDHDRLVKATKKAAIYERIHSMPNGFATTVGERGLTLSGGERQRIAIARALYSDPDFLFLDEASSALDEATENQIMEEIRRLATDVTIVAITHRSSTIRPDDCVVDLNK